MSPKKKSKEVSRDEKMFWAFASISLLCGVLLSGDIRTVHLPDLRPLGSFAFDRIKNTSDAASFGLTKWRIRIQGGDASELSLEDYKAQAEEELVTTGLPITEFCHPPGESPAISIIEIQENIKRISDGRNSTINAHCKAEDGRYFIQAYDSNNALPVYEIIGEGKDTIYKLATKPE